MTLSSDPADAVKPSIKAVARGVRVTDACNDAIKDMTATGMTPGPTKEAKACANGGAAEKRGNIIPPGNFAAQASAIETSFTIPTLRAARPLAYGTDGLTIAALVKGAISPCFVASKAVR